MHAHASHPRRGDTADRPRLVSDIRAASYGRRGHHFICNTPPTHPSYIKGTHFCTCEKRAAPYRSTRAHILFQMREVLIASTSPPPSPRSAARVRGLNQPKGRETRRLPPPVPTKTLSGTLVGSCLLSSLGQAAAEMHLELGTAGTAGHIWSRPPGRLRGSRKSLSLPFPLGPSSAKAGHNIQGCPRSRGCSVGLFAPI